MKADLPQPPFLAEKIADQLMPLIERLKRAVPCQTQVILANFGLVEHAESLGAVGSRCETELGRGAPALLKTRQPRFAMLFAFAMIEGGGT